MFMLHPINRPSHKKNVVLANSPLSANVKPYIDQMNVNQNFKNQMWTAQTGISPRQSLENDLNNRDFGIKSIFGDLVLSVLADTIPEKTDSLLNYTLIKGTLNERIITSPLFIQEERYTDAQTNLSELNYLNTTGSQQIIDFIRLQQLQIQLAQAPDSLRDSLIIANESMINSISNDTTHFCMADAMGLLEEAYDTLYPRNVYVGFDEQLRRQSFIPDDRLSSDINECVLIINPNPAHTFIDVIITGTGNTEDFELKFYDISGRIINFYKDLSKGLKIDLKGQKPGVYYIVLLNKSGIICYKQLIIE